MRVTIMQPAYLPWFGFFQRLAMSDLWIALDHVAIDRSRTGFVHRNRVRTPQGWTWLTLPLARGGGPDAARIDRATLARADWRRHHRRTLETNYRRCPHWPTYEAALLGMFDGDEETLIEVIRRTLPWQLEAFGITTPVVWSSTLGMTSTKADLVLDLCRRVGASSYLSGPLGRDYLDPDAFVAAGIDLAFHDVRPPRYDQPFPGFVEGLAAIDLLLNVGPESADRLRRVAVAGAA